MSNRFLTTGVAALLILGAATAHAQDIDLAAGQTELTYKGIEPNAIAGLWLDRGALSAGDGRRDMVIGAPGIPGLVGHVYVINGGPVRTGDLVLSSADAIITSTETGDLFGTSGAIGNILNLEGTNPRNLVVGAPRASGGKGVAYLFTASFSSNARLTTANAVFKVIGQAGDQLGSSFATADLDHDGYREILIGAPGNDRIYVIRGGPGLSGTRDLTSQTADYVWGGPGFGDVIAAGDVTGDGFSDIVVGAPAFNKVHLYRGTTSGSPLLPTFPSATFSYAAAVDDQVGVGLQIADINHDNIRDILIGAPGADGPANTRLNSGVVFVMWGSAAADALTTRDLSLADVTFWAAAGQQLGSYVTAGNANRDAIDDLVMIAAGGSNGSGDLIVYYGRDTGFGADAGGGRRVVDFAVAGNADRKILGLGSTAAGLFRTAAVFELTGEGAGDIVAGVPTSQGHAGVLYFTVSPKFTLSPDAVTVTANDNVVTPSVVTITNPSIIGVTWTVTSNRPWITLSAASGAVDRDHPAPLTINVSSVGMPLGTHTGSVTLTSTSKHLSMLLRIDVTLNRVPLAAPTFVTATPGTNGVQVRWGAVAGATSYTLRRINANGSVTVLGSGLTGTSFTDQGGGWNQGVRYTVSSVNSSAESGQSSPLTVPFGTAGSRTPTVQTARDYDGDGKADAAVYRSSNGLWLANRSSNGSLISQSWGAPSLEDQPVAADYDGDGKADIAIYRNTTGEWFILRSSNGALIKQTWGAAALGDLPVPADYDGDGKADIAIYRGSTGEWFILRSTNGTLLKQTWGAPSLNDLPVPADYDGDNKADIAIYRNTSGQWFILRSANGALIQVTWGAPSLGDVPVPEDYDNDGKADVGIYRATTGQWVIAKSGGGTLQQTWGSPGLSDVPVAGDFDGDNKADIAIYRFSTGEWFILRSGNGNLLKYTWGAPSLGDAVRFF